MAEADGWRLEKMALRDAAGSPREGMPGPWSDRCKGTVVWVELGLGEQERQCGQ